MVSSSRGPVLLTAVIGAALVASLASAACPSSTEHAFAHPFFGTALHHHHDERHPPDAHFFETAADDLAEQLNDLQTRLAVSESNAATLRSKNADAMQELRKMKCVNNQLRKHASGGKPSRGGFSCCSFVIGLITAFGLAMLGVHRRRLALAGSSAVGHVTTFLQRPDVRKAAVIAWKILRVLFFVLVALSFPCLGFFGFFVAPALFSVAMVFSCCCWRRPRVVVVRPPTVATPTAQPVSETTQPPKEASASPAPMPAVPGSTTTTPPEHAQLTRVLVSMGYDEVQAAEAVKATGSLELATDWILVREQDQQSPPQDQQSPPQKEAELPPQDQQSPPQKEAELNHLHSVTEEPGTPDEMTQEEPTRTTPMNQFRTLVTELTDMGFDEKLAQTAAERASGNLKSAVRILVERERNNLGPLASDW